MKTFFVDTNIFLRFILQDNGKSYQIACNLFEQTKNNKIKIVLLSEIILEIEYVLRKVYRFSRTDLQEALLGLVQNDYFEVSNRNLWIKTIEEYGILNLDLVDVFLFYSAQAEGAEVFSFDQDFARLKKHSPKEK